jgi:hypothetical protein
MSTFAAPAPAMETSPECPALLLQRLEKDPLLFQQNLLRERLLAMDQLDVLLGGSHASEAIDFKQMQLRALVLQSRLESANAELYQSVRTRVIRGDKKIIPQWLKDLAPDESSAGPRPGLGFDSRDDLMASIFQFRDPGNLSAHRSEEMVAYQPTPVRHVLRLLELVEPSADDLFVDLGSGLGHVPLLMSMLSGVRSLGIEIEPAYVANAVECAKTFQLKNTSFIAADARDGDLSMGTIFYLYSPFTGSILDRVLTGLRKQSQDRPIKICSLGPCSRTLERESWLKVRGRMDSNSVTLFECQ